MNAGQKPHVDQQDPQRALNSAMYGASVIVVGLMFPITLLLLPGEYVLAGHTYTSLGTFLVLVVGLVTGIINGKITEYYTSGGRAPVAGVVRASETGPATNVIAGLKVGNLSVTPIVLCITIAMYVVYTLAGLYGIALAAVGMLATIPMQLATDGYGPVADNAGGITEMAHLPAYVRERTDRLDAIGNTTAATGKGFAIGSAIMTALALLTAYASAAQLHAVNFIQVETLIGGFIGAALVKSFSAYTMAGVGNAAEDMIREVRRQFAEIPGLLAGKAGVEADYVRCVDIATRAALREMIRPCLIAILTPLIVGYIGGPEMLGGVLVVIIIAASVEALAMANAGGAWDNAKKTIEALPHGKNSPAHKAAVVGDTVGDPLKDTSGPSLNIVMKIVNVVAILSLTFI